MHRAQSIVIKCMIESISWKKLAFLYIMNEVFIRISCYNWLFSTDLKQRSSLGQPFIFTD